MLEAISNTSPLLYLYRIDVLHWLSHLFSNVWVPPAVCDEMKRGAEGGFNVPVLESYEWIQIAEPRSTPSEWLSLDLGIGELSAMALALENPVRVVLLDDGLARRIAQAAGLTVWGTLRVLLAAKEHELTERIEPFVIRLREAGMWLSDDVCQRILRLAGEGRG